MLHTLYFIIRPKTALIEKCSSKEDTAPIIWTLRLGDRGLWRMEGIAEGVKLLFLAEQMTESYVENVVYKLGIDALKVSHFDEFWELEFQLGPNDEVEEILKSYRGTKFEGKLKDTGNDFLTQWLG